MCIVTDTSVLINFLAVDQAGLLLDHPRRRFLITDHVRFEVTAYYPEQFARLEAILLDGAMEQLTVNTPEELDIFATLTLEGRLGAGECAAIAAAVHKGWGIAVDDRAARKQIARRYPHVPVETTASIVIELIRAGVLDITLADELRDQWESQHRFRLPFRSFREVI